MMMQKIMERVRGGARIDGTDWLTLVREATLHELGFLSHDIRLRLHPEPGPEYQRVNRDSDNRLDAGPEQPQKRRRVSCPQIRDCQFHYQAPVPPQTAEMPDGGMQSPILTVHTLYLPYPEAETPARRRQQRCSPALFSTCASV